MAPSLSFGLTKRYVAFFDTHGAPVWWYRADAAPSVVKLLPDDSVALAPSSGGYAVRDAPFEVRRLDGTLLRTIGTVGTPTDDHELQELPNGNYVVVSYPPRDHVDLSAHGGPSDATVVDAEIQEVDPEGSLVWSWNSKDHIALAETGRWWPSVISGRRTLPDGRTAYDPVHINAVEPDGDGLLVSMRHNDSVYRIARSDGHVDWKLGGTTVPESLSVTGEPNANVLGGQHDVRRLSDGTITVHDNGTGLGRAPRAVRYDVDPSTREATRLEVLADSEVTTSGCCGSARKLDSGGWLASWGGNPSVVEYGSNGARLIAFTFVTYFSHRALPVAPGRLSAGALRAGMDAMFPRE